MSHIITTSTQAYIPLEVTDLCTHHSNLCCGPRIVDVTTKVFRAHHIVRTTICLAERQNFIQKILVALPPEMLSKML